MKFLNLIIYSSGDEYDIMYKNLHEYLGHFSNVEHYFICCDSSMAKGEIKLQDNILYIGGYEESLVPGILHKTIDALKYCCPDVYNIGYDYVVRSNISTVIDFGRLENILVERGCNFNYGGAYGEVLNWIDIKSGITDKTYFGTQFIQGTNIMLSRYAVRHLLTHEFDLNYNVVDDVAIAIYMHKYITEIGTIGIIPGFVFIRPGNYNLPETYTSTTPKTSINCIFRHKTSDRKFDVYTFINTITKLKQI